MRSKKAKLYRKIIKKLNFKGDLFARVYRRFKRCGNLEEAISKTNYYLER